MKKTARLLIACMLGCTMLRAQSAGKPLLRPGFLMFKHRLYAYGYQQIQKELVFKCYSYDEKLQCKDSTEMSLGAHTPADFIAISADTLHDVLNFYFQLANQNNEASLLRTNASLQRLCAAPAIDANRVNTLAAFDDEKYTAGDATYVINTSGDSLNRQFYLTKYKVRSFSQPFEDVQSWQFAFERQFIHRASVIYADSSVVMVYVNVSDSTKRGQWVLRISATTGRLIKGTRISVKGDNRNFLYSNSLYDAKSKELTCIGNICSPAEIDFKTGKFDFRGSARNHQFFIVKIDSAGMVALRSEKAVPIPVASNALNAAASYHIKVRELYKTGDHQMAAWADVYEFGPDHLLTYYTSWYFNIAESDMGYDLAPGPFYVSSSAVPALTSRSKNDLYGKILLDDAMQYDRILYKKPVLPVLLKTGLDKDGKPFHVLVKTELNAGVSTFYLVSQGKKALESKVLLRCDKSKPATLFFAAPGTYTSAQDTGTGFELKINTL